MLRVMLGFRGFLTRLTPPALDFGRDSNRIPAFFFYELFTILFSGRAWLLTVAYANNRMIQAFAGTKHDLLAAIEMLSRNAIGPMSRSQIRMIHVFERPRFICTRNDEQMKNYSVRSLIDRSIRYAIGFSGVCFLQQHPDGSAENWMQVVTRRCLP